MYLNEKSSACVLQWAYERPQKPSRKDAVHEALWRTSWLLCTLPRTIRPPAVVRGTLFQILRQILRTVVCFFSCERYVNRSFNSASIGDIERLVHLVDLAVGSSEQSRTGSVGVNQLNAERSEFRTTVASLSRGLAGKKLQLQRTAAYFGASRERVSNLLVGEEQYFGKLLRLRKCWPLVSNAGERDPARICVSVGWENSTGRETNRDLVVTQDSVVTEHGGALDRQSKGLELRVDAGATSSIGFRDDACFSADFSLGQVALANSSAFDEVLFGQVGCGSVDVFCER